MVHDSYSSNDAYEAEPRHRSVGGDVRSTRMQAMGTRARFLLIGVLAAGGLVELGCRRPVEPPPASPPPEPLPRFPEVYERTARPYQRGAFLLPLEESVDRASRYLCPLFLQEIPADDATKSYRRFGALRADEQGRACADTDRLTAYLLPGQISRNEQSLRQTTFFWCYPPATPDAPLLWRGCRMTFTSRGFVMTWEILSEAAEPLVFYVSKPTEDAARTEFGLPLPGRRFTVEPDLKSQPKVIVARIVGDGPQPMGPILYLDHASLTVTTLRCRCEPPQVTDFAVTAHYRVVTLESAADLAELGIPETMRRALTVQEPLDAVLRLPRAL